MKWTLILTAALSATVLVAVPVRGVTTVSNGIYEVHVADVGDGFSVGSWNAITAASHPTGSGNDLLYDGFTVDTNFSSLRVYRAAGPVDYTFGGNGSGSAADLDPFVTGEGPSPFPGAGLRTTWSVTPESLNITQDVTIVGNTFNNSAIYHTVEVENTGDSPAAIGWRNLYDWAVNDPGFDDGPSNQIELSDGTVVVPTTPVEFLHTPGADELVRVSVFPGVATYEPLLALGFDPAFVPGLPVTLPDMYAYVAWDHAFSTDFDYVIGPDDVGSEFGDLDDSAGVSWFGFDAGRAVEVGAGSSVRFTQVILGVPPDAPPPSGRPIPEPLTATLGLLGLAAVGVATRRRRCA